MSWLQCPSDDVQSAFRPPSFPSLFAVLLWTHGLKLPTVSAPCSYRIGDQIG